MNFNRHLITGLAIILLLALSRLVPHPPNFTPILGMAVFSGAIINHKLFAYIIPLAAMLLSDLYLGFHASMPIIYFSLALCVLIGRFIEARVSILHSFNNSSLVKDVNVMKLYFATCRYYLLSYFLLFHNQPNDKS